MDFELYKDSKNPTIKKESVGTYSISIQKSKNEVWKELFKDPAEKKQYNPNLWYQLEDLYPQAMKEYFKLLDSKENNPKKTKAKKCRN
ncbi:MAG: hypothetical protein DHS20C13_28780 [Thermodesulfobacteriota bacterium]|nr:MAG: hypothetical protein DHS20C13_28780 [Thermodesulfobacteriota bacterium]